MTNRYIETVPRSARHAVVVDRWWTVDMIEPHIHSLKRHIELVYPLADIVSTLRAVMYTLDTDDPADVGPVGLAVWVRRSVRRCVYASEPDPERARDRHLSAVRLALWDAKGLLGTDEPDHELVAFETLPLVSQEILRLATVEPRTIEELAFILEMPTSEAQEQLTWAADQLTSSHDLRDAGAS